MSCTDNTEKYIEEEVEEEEEKVCEDCGEVLEGEIFTYCVGCLDVNVCEDCYNNWKSDQEEENDRFGYCNCGNYTLNAHICGHGVAAGFCCQCEECLAELEEDEEEEEEENEV